MDWLKLLKTIEPYVQTGGEIAGKIGANRAAGRQAENTQAALTDRQAIDRYQAEQQARLQAAQLQEQATQDRADRYLTAGRTRAGQAAFGDALANVQDVELDMPDGIPRFEFSGGLRPSIFGPNARAAGQTLSRDALAAMMSGADVPNLPNMGGLGGDAPGATPLSEANGFDRALNIGSYIGAGAGVVKEIQDQRQKDREAREAASRVPLPGISPIGYTPPITPGFELNQDLSGSGIAPRQDTLAFLAQMKAAEDAARQRGAK